LNSALCIGRSDLSPVNESRLAPQERRDESSRLLCIAIRNFLKQLRQIRGAIRHGDTSIGHFAKQFEACRIDRRDIGNVKDEISVALRIIMERAVTLPSQFLDPSAVDLTFQLSCDY
jgi:hypothetical protein